MSINVSIIIPVYNCEKYLDELIQSLLNQTLKNCEFIFINDGSTDMSLDSIIKYKKVDERIKIINQSNQGVSFARNSGLKLAEGEYIGFVDADDYIDNDMYETLYRAAKENDVDLVISDFEQEIEGNKIVNRLNIECEEKLYKKKIIEKILPQFIMHEDLNSVCNKLFKKDIIVINKLAFPIEVKLGEDNAFNMNYFAVIESLIYLNYNGYHYREVDGSATRNIFEKDYFYRALEVYKSELPPIYNEYFTNQYIDELKATKFINSIISFMSIYFKPQKDISLVKRFKYVKNIIANEEANLLIHKYFKRIYCEKGIYEKVLLVCIKIRFTAGIYILTKYSRIRCR